MKVYLEQHESEEKCLAKIRKQYGEHFTVIRMKNTERPIFLGFGSRPCVEIAFTLDGFKETLSRVTPLRQQQVPLRASFSQQTQIARPKRNDEEERIKILQDVAERSPDLASTLNPIIENKIRRQENAPIEKNATDLAVQHLASVVEQLNLKIEQMQSNKSLPLEAEHSAIIEIDHILEENEFTADYRAKLRTRMRTELSIEQLEDTAYLKRCLLKWLAESIPIRSEADSSTKPRVIVLVGPTGVGKTTTLAKLAAHYAVIMPKQMGVEQRVRVITTDNYRIGASEQIRKYCYHMKIPFALVENPADLKLTLDLHKEDADVICIDTSGRSQYDEEKLLAMKPYLELLPDGAEVYLTISAGTKATDIRDIMAKYSVYQYKSLIITKFDETRYTGNLLSVLAESSVPVVYLTNGQSVPRDFEVATVNRFLLKTHGLDFSEN